MNGAWMVGVFPISGGFCRMLCSKLVQLVTACYIAHPQYSITFNRTRVKIKRIFDAPSYKDSPEANESISALSFPLARVFFCICLCSAHTGLCAYFHARLNARDGKKKAAAAQ